MILRFATRIEHERLNKCVVSAKSVVHIDSSARAKHTQIKIRKTKQRQTDRNRNNYRDRDRVGVPVEEDIMLPKG